MFSASCVFCMCSPTTFRDCVSRHTMATSTPAMMLDPHSRQADSTWVMYSSWSYWQSPCWARDVYTSWLPLPVCFCSAVACVLLLLKLLMTLVLPTSSTAPYNFTYIYSCVYSYKPPTACIVDVYFSCTYILPLPHVLQGWDLFSCDCFGTVQHWDLRTHTTQGRWDFGPYAINSIAPDPAGEQMNHHTVSANDQLAVVLTQTLKTVWCSKWSVIDLL